MTSPPRHLRLGLLALLLVPCVAFGQAPAGEAGQAAEEAPAEAPGDQLGIDEILQGEEEVLAGEAGDGYSYDPAGRRDPFVSLLLRTQLSQTDQPRPPGVPGLLIDEIDIKGIFKTSKGYVAQISAQNEKKGFLLRPGDQVYDGDVLRITDNEVVFRQIVNDPTVIKPFREVVKKLRP
jgi:hypothetical protein